MKLPGWKTYKSCGTKSKAAALDVVQAELSKQKRKKEGFVTLGEYIEPFYDYDRCPHIQRIGGGITKKSAKTNRAYIKNHIIPDPVADIPILELRPRDIAAFRARIEKKTLMSPGREGRLSPATVEKIMNILKTVLNEAVLNRDIEYNPCLAVARRNGTENVNLRGVFTIDELKVLFEQKNWKDQEARTCFLLDAMTGMRCGEILALKWGCITEEQIDIQSAWKDTEEMGAPKWGKRRIIPMSIGIKKIIEQYRQVRTLTGQDDLLFCDKAGERRGTTWWTKNFQKAMALSGLPEEGNGGKRTPHSLRHTLNSLLLSSGVNPMLVRAYLGWSEDTRTKLSNVQASYTHFAVMDMQGLVRIVDSLFMPIVGGLV
jgi:integrase